MERLGFQRIFNAFCAADVAGRYSPIRKGDESLISAVRLYIAGFFHPSTMTHVTNKFRRSIVPKLFVAASIVSLAACATISEEAAFKEVSASVDQRINQKIEWPRNAEQEKAAAKALDTLLAKALTTKRAIQIALLNNRDLRATYADLGIARASLL